MLLDELNQSFETKEPLRIGGGGGPDRRFRGRDRRRPRLCAARSMRTRSRLAGRREPIAEICRHPAGRADRAARRAKLLQLLPRARTPRRNSARPRERRLRELRRCSEVRRERSRPTMVMEEMPTPRRRTS